MEYSTAQIVITEFKNGSLGKVDPYSIENQIMNKYSSFFWTKCSTFQDILNLQIEFLQGKIFATPYYAEPIYKETSLKSDILVEINKRGFITMDSQNGNDENSYDSEQHSDICGHGYLTGLMDKNLTNQFIKNFFKQFSDTYYIIKNDNICCSKDIVVDFKHVHCGYCVFYNKNRVLNFFDDLILDKMNDPNFKFGNLIEKCSECLEHVNIVKFDGCGRQEATVIPIGCFKIENCDFTCLDFCDRFDVPNNINSFHGYPQLTNILIEKCDSIEIICRKTGVSTIMEDIHYILKAINPM
jgi:hypothetical protein